MTSSPRRHHPVRTAPPALVALLTVGSMTASVALAPPAEAGYLVGAGETLSDIAHRHGVSVQALADLNALPDPDRILSGQELAIPGRDVVDGRTHTVQPGETLSHVAARYGISAAALAAANGLSDPDLVRSGTPLALLGGGAVADDPAASQSPPSGGASDPAVRAYVGDLIRDAAARYGWRPDVPLALAMNESGWNNSVVSSAGAIGIMQVLPATGEWVGTYLLGRTVDLTDPADNVEAGVAYLDWLYRNLGRDVELALAAYYEGYGRVTRSGPSEGARHYVDVVLALVDDTG